MKTPSFRNEHFSPKQKSLFNHLCQVMLEKTDATNWGGGKKKKANADQFSGQHEILTKVGPKSPDISTRWAPTIYKWSYGAPINGLING